MIVVGTGVTGVLVEYLIIVVVTWETDGRLTLIFATIIHSGHNNLVQMGIMIALGDTMLSVVVDIQDVMTKVIKSFILGTLVI